MMVTKLRQGSINKHKLRTRVEGEIKHSERSHEKGPEERKTKRKLNDS